MKIAGDNAEAILTALDRQILLLGGDHVSLVVCGGTALAVLGLVPRTTKDVDVLAMATVHDGLVALQKVELFPEWLSEAARKVGRDFNLPEGWFNAGPTGQLDLGVPHGFESRLVKVTYGSRLDVFFVGRFDQIHFKLFAAVDRNDYHTQDLLALGPSGREMEQAALWVLTQDVSEPFRMLLETLLKQIGYEDVAERL